MTSIPSSVTEKTSDISAIATGSQSQPAVNSGTSEPAWVDVHAGAQDGQRRGMARLSEQAGGQRNRRCRSGQDDLAVVEFARDGDAHPLADRQPAARGRAGAGRGGGA